MPRPSRTENDGAVPAQPGQICGEVCANPAAVEIEDGGYLYCWSCVARLMHLGIIFDAAIAEARRV